VTLNTHTHTHTHTHIILHREMPGRDHRLDRSQMKMFLKLLLPGGGGDMGMFRGQGGGTVLPVLRELLASLQLLFLQELSNLWGERGGNMNIICLLTPLQQHLFHCINSSLVLHYMSTFYAPPVRSRHYATPHT